MGEDLREEKEEVGISARERSAHIAEVEEELQRGISGEGSPVPTILHGGCWLLPITPVGTPTSISAWGQNHPWHRFADV